MKTIYKSFLFALIAAAGFTACDDYEAPDLPDTSAVKIISQETSLPATASTGAVKFEAKGPVTVTSSAQWLTASVDGDVINLLAEQNNSLNGRAATVTIKCGSATDEISVIQSGLIFKFAEVSNINLESDAKTFTYQADASIPVQVSTDADWMTAAITDGTLTIDVTRNTMLSPRAGKITLTVGELTYDITVNQGALQCPLVKVTSISQNDAAKTYTYDFPTDIAVDFTTPDWIKASFANETITITVEENNEGHIREGEFTWSVDGTSGTVAVSQYEFEKDIAGEYYWFYTNPADGEDYYIPATFTKDGSDYLIKYNVYSNTGIAYPMSIPVTWNDKTRTFNLAGGSYIGKFGSYFTYTSFTFLDPDDGKIYYTWDSKASMNGTFVYFEQKGSGYTAAEFVDAQTLGYELMYLQIHCFKSQPPSGDNSAGYLQKLMDPMFMRVHDLSGATSTNSAATPVKRLASKSSKIKANAKLAPAARLSLDTALPR